MPPVARYLSERAHRRQPPETRDASGSGDTGRQWVRGHGTMPRVDPLLTIWLCWCRSLVRVVGATLARSMPPCARNARPCRRARGTRDHAAVRAERATMPPCARDACSCRLPSRERVRGRGCDDVEVVGDATSKPSLVRRARPMAPEQAGPTSLAARRCPTPPHAPRRRPWRGSCPTHGGPARRRRKAASARHRYW
jgi:hypothetical protein